MSPEISAERNGPERTSFFRRFARRRGSESGMAATEFALVLPVALILFTGSYIYGTVNEINRKVTLTARDVTDLVTQYTAISLNDMSTLLNSSVQVMAPFSSSNVVMIISQVTMNSAGNGTVAWSVALNGTGYSKGASVTLPTAIQGIPAAASASSVSVIWGHVSYVYTPSIGYNVTGPFTLSDDIYLSPRLSATVAYPASASAP
jgi:Flp pilus assembly protein TadG